ncbi:hypothetical protein Q1695_002577 [Nippostrongylus brasiliensis]|nr:hypothetical protein Q1695_002577 [Nippostrongylus brasiliensis]
MQKMSYQYMLCQFLIPLAYTVYLTIEAILTTSQELVQCSIPQAFGPSAFALMNHFGFGIHISNVMIYMISFFGLRRSGASTKKKRAFKSIFITVSIMICGWIVTFLVNTLSMYITKDLNVRGLLNMYAGISINIGLTSNVFVFYTINTEYRYAIRRMLCIQRKDQIGHKKMDPQIPGDLRKHQGYSSQIVRALRANKSVLLILKFTPKGRCVNVQR